MTTEYIVKFTKVIDGLFDSSVKTDGFVELSPSNNNSRIPTISVRTHKKSSDENNLSLLFKFMTSNFADVKFDDDEKTCSLTYKDGYSRSIEYKSIMEFDSNSSSAYNDFKSQFQNLINTEHQTIYYDSGRTKYIGDVKNEDGDDIINGEGTLYHDTFLNKPKYVGEFEDNEFDGSGKFFNIDNNISLVANNISNGIPVQTGKLIVDFRNRKEIISFDFDDLWLKLDIKNKNEKRTVAKLPDFVNMITSKYLNRNERSMDQLIFEDKTSSEQNIIVWSDIQKIKDDIVTIRKDANINMNNMVKVTKALTTVLIFNLLVNLVALYLS